MNKDFNKDVLENLKSEITELNCKIKKAREEENWGTYKNIILAYTNVLDTINKYDKETKNKKDMIDIIYTKYYENGLFNDSVETNELLRLIKEELSIDYDCKCHTLSPNHSWEFLNLLSKVILKILENEIKNPCNFLSGEYKHFELGKEMKFKIYNDNNNFKIESGVKHSRVQKFYNAELELDRKHAKTDVCIKLEDIIDGKEDIIRFLKSCVLGYVEYIKNEEKEIDDTEVFGHSKNYKVGIAGYPNLKYNADDNILEIDTIIGVGLYKM